MDLLVQNVRLDSKIQDVLIQDGKFAQIAPRIEIEALPRTPQTLDGTGQALLQELPRKEYILFAAVAFIGGLLWARYRWRLRRTIRAAANNKKTPV